MSQQRTLVPQNGHTLMVGNIARISGCINQKEVSLEDQEDNARIVVAEMYNGPTEFEIIATVAKGEALDRPELEQIEKAYRSGKFDLMVAEDLGRLVRGVEAVRLLGIGKDHGTRTIVPNDGIDTDEPNWEERATNASASHVAHNEHASLRIKTKSFLRFLRNGGCPARPIAGYEVPPGAKTYGEWKLVAEATEVILRGLSILEQTFNCETVAEYFNNVPYGGGIGFPTGPYARECKKWCGASVRRFFKNRLLGGAPGRGFKRSVKKHEIGRRQSVHNPDGPKFISVPHLAHVDLARLDAVNEMLRKRNSNLGRAAATGIDPRQNVPRKVTRWPGQDAICWYCGRICVWGGNGITNHLMCSGAREWHCWHSIGFDGELLVKNVCDLIVAELDQLENFDQQFRMLVQQAGDGNNDTDERLEQLHCREQAMETKRTNVKKLMAELGPNPLVISAMKDLEAGENALVVERKRLESLRSQTLQLPPTIQELRGLFEVKFLSASRTSREFNALLRRLVPECHVYCVRLCDGGHPLPRARIRLALDGIIPDAAAVPCLGELLTRVKTIDLFQAPQRERIRKQAVALASQGLHQREIGRRITEQPSQAAVQNAMVLDETMRSMGLTDPYVRLSAPPADYAKMCRHQNRKYHFTPVLNYLPPDI